MKKGVSWWLTVETTKRPTKRAKRNHRCPVVAGRADRSPGRSGPGRRPGHGTRSVRAPPAEDRRGRTGEPVDDDGNEDEVEDVVERLRREVVLPDPVADAEEEGRQPPGPPGDVQPAHEQEERRQAGQVDGDRPDPHHPRRLWIPAARVTNAMSAKNPGQLKYAAKPGAV